MMAYRLVDEWLPVIATRHDHCIYKMISENGEEVEIKSDMEETLGRPL